MLRLTRTKRRWIVAIAPALLAFGCVQFEDPPGASSPATGGAEATTSAGSGAAASGGESGIDQPPHAGEASVNEPTDSAGAAQGGQAATGGVDAGGADTGGQAATGGVDAGGADTGGADTGGAGGAPPDDCGEEPLLGSPCVDGELPCLLGTFACEQGHLRCALQPSRALELLGKPCTSGVGTCRREGHYACLPGGIGLDCDAEPGQPQEEESCAATLDDDCDGQINEGCSCTPGVSLPLPCPGGAHVCTAGARECLPSGQFAVECTGRVVASDTENACDGFDEDCDGSADDDFFVGTPCRAFGQCGMGTIECATAHSVRCSSEPGGSHSPKHDEICDADELDEDCDGSANEGCTCVPGAIRSCGSSVGTCKMGSQRCAGAPPTWGDCLGGKQPSAELCDALDNDCDGEKDEDFALNSDPAHCGSCNVHCSFDHGEAACLHGECVLGRCQPGFGDADRVSSNGCECTVTEAVEASCDNVDNDCNGVIDLSIDAGRTNSLCHCVPTDFEQTALSSTDEDQQNPTCTTELCDPLEGGATGLLKMDFCCNKSGAWSQCVLKAGDPALGAKPLSLQAFDADRGSRGLLEVVFQLSEETTNLELHLWYGSYPRRKRLLLLAASPQPTRPGTFVRYFRPEDAECPAYDPAVLNDKQNFGDFPAECVAQPNPQTHRICADGKWSSLGARCAFDYSQSLIYLTAESCLATVESSATLVSVRYFEQPASCACETSGDCAEGTGCHSEANLSVPNCATCTGICSGASSGCPGEGSPCEVTQGNQSCASHIICVGDTPVCPACQ